ncbi:D-arabinono-1,4-lactone oxidase [Haloechinothrix sp. LS1_15]|uniref:D-arabinono-1,4-lactone oxidase n=1 Tax=Haloechinothrix sp. LS1_15 TaxID=2652248 RepID=UPI0029454A49|nr:D-arabinono-1,4-lactone oxidase [Haloechinothrix sp. LS1_15]MDV6010896.1 FAD-binding protein [Haloechinothrix sp. LS1_15]
MSDTTWTNWAGTAHAAPRVVHRPRSTAEIAHAVSGAAASGGRIRPWGSGHSFSPAAVADDQAIDLSGFTGVTRVDMEAGLVTVRSGTTLRQLNTILDALDLALVNLGDIDAQTISGAIATGTHGTGASFGGLATQVVELELVLADGSVVTCSPVERPELFQAARIGLGALGVISTVTLRCVPGFVLAAQERPEPLDRLLPRLDNEIAGNDHFEFYWFPYGEHVVVKRNNRLPPGTPPQPLGPLREFLEYEILENRAFEALCRLGKAVPGLVRPLGAVTDRMLSTRQYRDRSHRVFVTRRSVPFVESEYAIPRAAVGDVLTELRAVVPLLRDPVSFPVEVRFAAADDIWLSTAHQRDSAYIAVHQYAGMPYREYFAAFEAIMTAAGGRPHWGKMHSLDATALAELYPRFDDFLRLRDQLDPTGVFSNPYTDHVLGPVGGH